MLDLSNMGLERDTLEAAARLAPTPGVLLVKVEVVHTAANTGRKSCESRIFAGGELPERIELPTSASGARVIAFGAFEPGRPTDTADTLLAELNRERKSVGLPSLPRGTDVKSLGFDDLGFLTYQITLEVRRARVHIAERPQLCSIA